MAPVATGGLLLLLLLLMYVGCCCCCCCCCCAAVLAETYSYGTVRTAQYFLAAILSRFGGIIDSAQYCRSRKLRLLRPENLTSVITFPQFAHLQDVRRSRRALRRGQGVLPPAGSRAETACQPTTSPEVARGSMAIGGAVSVAAVRHMHSTVERETDQLKNADANSNIVVSAYGCGRLRSDCNV